MPADTIHEHKVPSAMAALKDKPVIQQVQDEGTHLPPPPDGGKAWMQVLVGHLVLFNTWGYINSYAFFESYYTETLGLSLSDVSWAGSVQIFLLLFIGTFSGRAIDAGYLKLTFTIGIAFQLIGIFATSAATHFWQLFLAQGVCGGIGDGLMFCPTIALVSVYFSRRKPLAMCLVASGSATGGVVFPLIAQQLLNRVGFGWTVRVMGFVVLFNGVVILLFAKTRLPPRSNGPLVEWQAFTEVPYTLFMVGTFLCLWSLYTAFSYVGYLSETENILSITTFGKDVVGQSTHTSLIVLFFLNAVGSPGRIIPGLIAVHIGPLNTLIPAIACTGILFFCWARVHSSGGLFAFAAVFGFANAAVQGLVLSGLPSLTSDLSKTGVRTGMILSCVSVATLTGGPLFGALIERNDGKYLYAQIWAGLSLFTGGALITCARASKVGWEVRKRM